MNRTNAIFLLSTILVTSCNHVYKRYDKESFPTFTWDSGTGIIFNPHIADTSKSYKLIFGIRHIYGFPLESLNVQIRIISPSGKEIEKIYEIRIKKANGDYLGSCGGDLCDLETPVDNIQFEEVGNYTFFVSHDSRVDKILGVMEVGLIIDEPD